ncbi:Cell death protease [Tulasnella sp. 403]|nr:Cell death protease [Tulasnella sp. 403]
MASLFASRLACIASTILAAACLVHSAPAPPPEQPSAASFYVPSLPGFVQDPNHPIRIYAGHLLADPSASVATPSKNVLAHLYFVLLKARRTADKERLIIWFNGGPGCSSFDGLMMEVGPWRVDGKGGLKSVDGGWDEYAHVLYIDQPPGTGYSYASTDSYLHDLDQVSAYVNQFLINFYAVFPEFKTIDTWIAGESFAGQYIPYIADGILKTTLLSTPLKGIAIGNGWIDGRSQYPAYYDFAVKSGLIKENSDTAKKTREALERCTKSLNATHELIQVNYDDCDGVMSTVTEGLIKTVNGKQVCLNVYDVRLSDDYPACGMNWPPDLAGVTDYLRRSDVVNALHATDKAEAWTECQGQVFSSFNAKKSASSVTLLPSILEKIPVMLFAGDQDYICNYMGIENIISGLDWNSGTGLGDSPVLPWKVNGTDAGTWVTSRNLTYVKVFGASHMVGFDVPVISQDMIYRFMGLDIGLNATLGQLSRIPSSVGDDVREAVTIPSSSTSDPSVPATNPVDDQAKWDAYYNAGSAALTLVLILLAIGLFFYFRKRKHPKGVALARDDDDQDETIPLSSNIHTNGGHAQPRLPRGKTRVPYEDRSPVPGEPIFDVGENESDSDTERGYKDNK